MANETNTGWVRLYRSTLNWEWLDDPLTLQLWVVCLLKANWTTTRWQGMEIERGSFVASVGSLCTETGQTARQIRTRLARLQASGEISIRATNQKSVVTICKFDTYQPVENASDKRPTNSYEVLQGVPVKKVAKIDERNDKPESSPKTGCSNTYDGGPNPSDKPNDNRATNDRQTQLFSSDNSIRIYKDIKKEKNLSFACAHATAEERETFFEIFFFRNFQKPDYEVERFCANYEASGWIRKNGQPAVDRPALARSWTQEDKNAAPRFAADFLKHYKELYAATKLQNRAAAATLIRDLEGVAVTDQRMDIACSGRLMEIIERNLAFFKTIFFEKYYAGRAIHYHVPRK